MEISRFIVKDNNDNITQVSINGRPCGKTWKDCSDLLEETLLVMQKVYKLEAENKWLKEENKRLKDDIHILRSRLAEQEEFMHQCYMDGFEDGRLHR